jgi:hypothetical protein
MQRHNGAFTLGGRGQRLLGAVFDRRFIFANVDGGRLVGDN